MTYITFVNKTDLPIIINHWVRSICDSLIMSEEYSLPNSEINIISKTGEYYFHNMFAKNDYILQWKNKGLSISDSLTKLTIYSDVDFCKHIDIFVFEKKGDKLYFRYNDT